VFLASVIECNVAIICACAPSIKAIFGKYFENVVSRYGSRSRLSFHWKNSGGTSTSERDSRTDPLGSATELERAASKPKLKDSQQSKPLQGIGKRRGPQSCETLDSYQGDANVGSRVNEVLPNVRTTSPLISRLSDASLSSPSQKHAVPARESFLITSDDASDDEISLMSKSYGDHITPDAPGRSSPANELLQHQISRDSRKFSVDSVSRPGQRVLNEPPQPDPLMPAAGNRPRVRRDLSKERLEHTRYPAL
jgi:hypothetical protein